MDRELLYRFFLCRTGAEEEKKIADWLDADPDNFSKFLALRQDFEATVIHAPESAPAYKSPRRLLRRIAAVAGAAAAAAALVVAAGYFSQRSLQEQFASQTVAVEVPAGQRICITLPDSTQVWINSQSRLEYPPVFGATRRVRLEGEAQFEVKHDSRHPFVVETFACDVEVLGTLFDVTAEKQSGIFETALLNGRIKVTGPGGDEAMILDPGQVVRLQGGRLVLQEIVHPDAYMWPDGLIGISGLTFRQVMEKFEKAYDVNIVIERSVMPTLDYTSGKLRVSDGVDCALRILQRASDFRYRIDHQTNTVTIL